MIVADLQNRGHLPRITETEEPAADDALLILRAMIFGVAQWLPLDGKKHEPRGSLDIRSNDGFTQRCFPTKLVKGVPGLDDRSRSALEEVVAYHMRRL